MSSGYGTGHSGTGTGYGGGTGGYAQTGKHGGRGPKKYKRSDERIEEEINERLTYHTDIDASEVDVEVKDGAVTLRGTVERRHEKRIAEDVAEGVWGVKDVRNEIRVQSREDTYGEYSGSGSHGTGSTSSSSSSSGSGSGSSSGSNKT